MIGMKIFITILLAAGVLTTSWTLFPEIADSLSKKQKIGVAIAILATYVIGIIFTWVM